MRAPRTCRPGVERLLARGVRNAGSIYPTRSMNCGCGEVNERHKPGDIVVLDDLKKAAQNHNLDVQQAADTIQKAAT